MALMEQTDPAGIPFRPHCSTRYSESANSPSVDALGCFVHEYRSLSFAVLCSPACHAGASKARQQP